MNRVCLVCNGNTFRPLYENTLLQCVTCDFITANITVTREELERIYNDNYFEGKEYENYKRDKELIQSNFKKRLEQILNITDRRDIKNILEIGCAYGFFGDLATRMLKNTSYTGYDIVEEAINYGKKQFNINISCQDYLTVSPGRKYSDVFMWDVIEHLEKPHNFIEKIKNELITGGRLYITTGDIGSFLPKIQKQKWRLIHPPTHLHYFSAKTLTHLLHKNGFKIRNISYPPVKRSVKFIYYSLFMLKKNTSKLIEKIYDFIPSDYSIEINTCDIMFIIAEKF